MSIRPNVFPDALSAILSKLGLEAEIFMQADLCGEWAMDTSGFRKVPFHLVEQGTGWLHGADTEQAPQLLGSGDFVVFPHNAVHCIASGFDRPPAEIMNQIPVDPKGRITSLLCGFFEFRNRSAWPLLDSLPDVVVLNLKESGYQHSAYPLVQLMISELKQNRPGKGEALNKLAYLLFIQVLRIQVEAGTSVGLLSALADKQIGHVLNLLHVQYSRNWSVADLAKEVAISRSVFSERFVHMVGKTPMRYLAEWRMLEASDMLRTTDSSIATIAENVGYGSEMAFRKAFRKITGQTPGTVRRQSKDIGPARRP
ncbi:MAG: AraC family transcriptional activator of mtrCDE [Flavobacteriales bacterium]|jgi:AraC family transcriptional activator of mtrCDE